VSEAVDHQQEARARAFVSPSVLLDAITAAGLPPGPREAAESIGLRQALAAVADPRDARGRRHSLQSILPLAVGAVLAVDGKTVRGARSQDGEQTKLLAVFDHADQPAISQVAVVDGDELSARIPVLDTIADLRAVVVTADALHCQRAHAEYLHARGACQKPRWAQRSNCSSEGTPAGARLLA
jgi:hypothetical protein